jgi:hypothetical protein
VWKQCKSRFWRWRLKSRDLCQSAVSIEPGEGSLYNPSAREEVKASNPSGARDDLDCPVAKFGQSLAQIGTVIDAVGKQMVQPGKRVVDDLDDNPGAIAILDVGRMDYNTTSRRVGHNMASRAGEFDPHAPRSVREPLSSYAPDVRPPTYSKHQ